jgi:integrase
MPVPPNHISFIFLAMNDFSKFDGQLAIANADLKAANLGLRIIRRGSKLSIRGMFPNKDGGGKSQQILSLDVYANTPGLQRAKKEAAKISGLIALKEFDWADFIEIKSAAVTCGEWIARLETDYFTRKKRTPKTETTWNGYRYYLEKLPGDAPLTREVLLIALNAYEADQRSRAYCVVALGMLAKFAGIDFDVKAYRGSYSPKMAQKKDIPSDEEIIEAGRNFKNPHWRWAFFVMATYGLRNCELTHIDLDTIQREPGIIFIKDGKTGPRWAWPWLPEWWEKFDLKTVLMPSISGKNNQVLGARVTLAFKREGFPKPGRLRHAYAERLKRKGVEESNASDLMGHSSAVHQIYISNTSEEQQKRAFEALRERCDRL